MMLEDVKREILDRENILGKVDMVLMRPFHDNSKGQDCKLNLYKTFIEPYYNVLFL